MQLKSKCRCSSYQQHSCSTTTKQWSRWASWHSLPCLFRLHLFSASWLTCSRSWSSWRPCHLMAGGRLPSTQVESAIGCLSSVSFPSLPSQSTWLSFSSPGTLKLKKLATSRILTPLHLKSNPKCKGGLQSVMEAFGLELTSCFWQSWSSIWLSPSKWWSPWLFPTCPSMLKWTNLRGPTSSDKL